MKNDFVITATETMRNYAAVVSGILNKYPDFLAKHSLNAVSGLDVKCFADGEMEVEISTSVRGKDVIIFSSSARNEAGLDVNKAKLELYHAVDALKRSRAERIIVFEPYVSCGRSDRPLVRNSVGLWIHFKTLVNLGVSHIVTYQLHSDKSKAMIDPALCVFDDVPIFTLLKKYLCDHYVKDINTLETTVHDNWAFCSVDAGGEKLTQRFANAFNAPLVVAHKQRDYSKANTIESINILSAEPISGKVLWIVDDMIDTGGSVQSLIHALAKQNPAEINIVAAHAPFSDPARERLAALTEQKLLKRIIVTDTVYFPPSMPQDFPNLQIVPSAELSARVISKIVSDSSMSDIHRTFSAREYLNNLDLFAL
ncbi:MAG: ribose-phosphate diphosphokinase [Spirochaetaceae bacterium]|jgi:ribose-phosphate pyrophosphokinase|nr:ribose-phosphate diphosphokinase [Spirochaetaceae bacterium]